MPEELVSLEQVKAHLGLPVESGSSAAQQAADDELQLYLETAQELVIAYVKQRRDEDEAEAWAETVEAWTEETAPKQVLAAIRVMTAHLYRMRGDDAAGDQPKQDDGRVPFLVRMYLDGYRDPTVA